MQMQIFNFEGAADVRTLTQGETPWFVAADLCAILAIDNISMACNRLDEDERGITTVDTPSGKQQMLIVSESGLWSLVLTSRKPDAKRLKKWITAEVLPAIRQTGSYAFANHQPVQPDLFEKNQRDLLALYKLELGAGQREIADLKGQVASFKDKLIAQQAAELHLHRSLRSPKPKRAANRRLADGEREEMRRLHQQGQSVSAIAKATQRSTATVSWAVRSAA